jgi:conjugative relaxase-like TrwC/TraI family protein
MLRITQQNNAKEAKRYYAVADYYSEGQEIVGSWGGVGARLLGLEGVVDRQSFERLCDNLEPISGKQLTVRSKSERTVGYDFTFSVPKSVSVLYAMSGDQGIMDAFRASVAETMREIEGEMKTRVRKGRKDVDRTTGNMVWAEFIHTTSRPVDGIPDPQLHAHAFAFNSTWDDQERRWKAGQFRDLKRDAPYFQAAFRVRLANKLQDLGFGIERKRDDFEIAGIPASLVRKFSRRTELIEQVAKERGIVDPDRKAELGAETRESKTAAMSWTALRREWDKWLNDAERQVLAAVHRRATPAVRPAPGERLAVDYALEHSFVGDSVVSERKLLTEALKRGVGSVTVAGVKRELAVRPLIRGEFSGREMATTPEMQGLETRLVEFAKKGRGRFRPLGDPGRPCSRDWLNDGQKAAVRHVLGSRDRVTIIRGAAGTGKTTLEQEIGEALADAGRPVVALAQSITASRGVLREEAGFAGADTVARFLVDKEMQTSVRGGVILVDEASQLGTRDMAKLFGLAEALDARLVLVGDRRQHRSVTAGEPLALLEDKAGLPVASVTEILRQSGDYKKAAQALSEGRVADAFAVLDKLGWIKEVADSDRYKELAAAYLAATAEKKRGGQAVSALVVSPTHAEAARITGEIRAALKAEGKLGEERTVRAWVPAHLTDPQKADAANYEAGDLLRFHQNAPGYGNGSRVVLAEGATPPVQCANHFEVYRPAALTLAAGDRVRITASGTTKDGEHRLSNGDLRTVKGFTSRGDLVIDNGWVIDRDFGHLALGYVITSHASQGRTVDRVIVGQSSESFPASNQRQFYVSASRGKHQALIFTDDKKALLKAVARPDEALSATDFAQSFRRKAPQRRRLHKHLAFIRRIGNLGQSQEAQLRQSQQVQTLQKEMDHVR